ncbi:hypothetical protein PTSG_03918 [Salpingoeca rosetta]|uniref:Uncharacterized protein n=1 Tax=Salpingoeca rosetta (strain ATCC 50818 / BSB-021) TaxID=946362 RepID=F2U792_SALR5|nr:uncharacterized protein PTSG_03918 [Salpingoeca rosetta]EGD83309.1 hypothetical protein PTSG_03918 [Salpingoeca rosetta]|eukprot:XP_004994813.1 hypothetical protein PTSG_03918 [Salpingoeca rosetta]
MMITMMPSSAADTNAHANVNTNSTTTGTSAKKAPHPIMTKTRSAPQLPRLQLNKPRPISSLAQRRGSCAAHLALPVSAINSVHNDEDTTEEHYTSDSLDALFEAATLSNLASPDAGDDVFDSTDDSTSTATTTSSSVMAASATSCRQRQQRRRLRQRYFDRHTHLGSQCEDDMMMHEEEEEEGEDEGGDVFAVGSPDWNEARLERMYLLRGPLSANTTQPCTTATVSASDCMDTAGEPGQASCPVDTRHYQQEQQLPQQQPQQQERLRLHDEAYTLGSSSISAATADDDDGADKFSFSAPFTPCYGANCVGGGEGSSSSCDCGWFDGYDSAEYSDFHNQQQQEQQQYFFHYGCQHGSNSGGAGSDADGMFGFLYAPGAWAADAT